MENPKNSPEITPLSIIKFRQLLGENNFDLLEQLNDFVAEKLQPAFHQYMNSQGVTNFSRILRKSLLWHAVIGSSVSDTFNPAPENVQEKEILEYIDRSLVKLIQHIESEQMVPTLDDILN